MFYIYVKFKFQVTIINATTVDFSMVNMPTRTEQNLGGEIIARLLGFLRLPDSWGNEILHVCASYSIAVLNMSHDREYSKMVSIRVICVLKN